VLAGCKCLMTCFDTVHKNVRQTDRIAIANAAPGIARYDDIVVGYN